MANKTYLELVNDVLVRLRENEVTSVNDTAYSKLISKFVNDGKRQVEDAYNWNALSETLTVSTTANLFNYVMTNAGIRFRVFDVINDTSDWFMDNASTSDMNNKFLNQTPELGSPRYYNFNGVDSNGDTQVDRGEDGGLSSSEAYALYQTSLADHVANEGNHYPDEFTWDAV